MLIYMYSLSFQLQMAHLLSQLPNVLKQYSNSCIRTMRFLDTSLIHHRLGYILNCSILNDIAAKDVPIGSNIQTLLAFLGHLDDLTT